MFFPLPGPKARSPAPDPETSALLLRPRLPHRVAGIEHAASGVLRLDGAPARCTWVIISVTFEKVYNPCVSRAVTRIFKVSIALANPYSSSL